MNLFYYPVQPNLIVDRIREIIADMDCKWFYIGLVGEVYGRFGPFPIVTSYSSVVGVRM